MIFKIKFLIRIFFTAFFIFFLHFLATKFHWYFSIWWFDILVHFLGGFLIGLILVLLFYPKFFSFTNFFKIFFGFIVIGIGWEIFEILVDQFITQNSFNFLDTLSDLFVGLGGATIALFYFLKKL